jgi:hypothetical protein
VLTSTPDPDFVGTNSDDFDFAVDASTPNGHIISFDLDITASNGGPWSDTFDVPVTCAGNTPPTLSGLPDVIVDETTSLPVTIDLWAYASDAETSDSGLTYTIEGSPPTGAGMTIVSNHYLTIDPSTSWCSYTDVTVRVTDPGGLWDNDTLRVAITWSCQG